MEKCNDDVGVDAATGRCSDQSAIAAAGNPIWLDPWEQMLAQVEVAGNWWVKGAGNILVVVLWPRGLAVGKCR